MAEASLQTTSLHLFVERIQAGDEKAQDELFRRISRRLEQLASKRLRTFPGVRKFEDTNDVMQAAAVRLLRALKSIKPDNTRAFYGLAAEQIRRQLIDFNRHYQNMPMLLEAKTGTISRGLDPVDEAGAKDSLAELERWTAFHLAVEKLLDEEKEVVELVFYHGWTQPRIAELMQVNVRTVRRYWHSACVRLHELLQGELPSF